MVTSPGARPGIRPGNFSMAIGAPRPLLPPPPDGFVYLLGADGAYLRGADGAYLLGAA